MLMVIKTFPISFRTSPSEYHGVEGMIRYATSEITPIGHVATHNLNLNLYIPRLLYFIADTFILVILVPTSSPPVPAPAPCPRYSTTRSPRWTRMACSA
jgi:hypothetical protein